MSLVSFQERDELADSPNRGWLKWNTRSKTMYRICPQCNAMVRNGSHSCRFSRSLTFYYRGKERTCSLSDFKFYGIKLPLVLAVLFLVLASMNEIFLFPLLVVGLVLYWSIQTYLRGPENRLYGRDVISNKESIQ